MMIQVLALFLKTFSLGWRTADWLVSDGYSFIAGRQLIGFLILALFSFYLTPEKNGNALLTFGGIDTSKYTGDLTYSDLSSGATYWTLDSTGISINGQTTTLLGTARTIIFDTGTSNVMFDTDIAEVSCLHNLLNAPGSKR